MIEIVHPNCLSHLRSLANGPICVLTTTCSVKNLADLPNVEWTNLEIERPLRDQFERKFMNDYLVSPRKARQRLVNKERLRASMAKTYDAALRWHHACQATATPGLGDGLPALGQIVSDVLSVAEGQKKLVRWHDGTMTITWIPAHLLAVYGPVTWIVASTRWNDPHMGPWLSERVMRVETLLDAMPATVRSEYEQYWRLSRELFELDVESFLIDNQGGQ